MKPSEFQKNTRKRFSQLTLFILIAFLFVYNLFFWIYTYKVQENKINQVQVNLIDQLDKVSQQNNEILRNEVFYQNVLDVLNKRSNEETLFANLNKTISDSDYRFNLLLFDKEGDYLTGNNPEEHLTSSFLLKAMLENYTQELRILRTTEDENYLISTQKINQDEAVVGYVVFVINAYDVKDHLGQQEAHYAITSRDRFSFIVSDRKFVSKDFNMLNKDLTQPSARIEDQEYNSKMIEYNENILLFGFISSQDFLILNLITSFLLLIVGVVLIYSFRKASHRIVSLDADSIEELTDQMEEVVKDQRLSLDVSSNDEIEEISDQINELIRDLETRHSEDLELVILDHKAELKQLMKTLNPSFLSDSLNLIQEKMKIDHDLSNELINQLLEVVEYNLSDQDLVTLEEELRYLDSYLSVLKVLYVDKLSFEFINHLQSLKVLVPHLLLQPLIENAIRYGFSERRKLSIQLKFYEDEESIYIVVLDDGPGISATAIAASKEPSTRGIYTSRRKLELFDAQSHFDISASHPMGTLVTLKFKKQFK